MPPVPTGCRFPLEDSGVIGTGCRSPLEDSAAPSRRSRDNRHGVLGKRWTRAQPRLQVPEHPCLAQRPVLGLFCPILGHTLILSATWWLCFRKKVRTPPSSQAKLRNTVTTRSFATETRSIPSRSHFLLYPAI